MLPASASGAASGDHVATARVQSSRPELETPVDRGVGFLLSQAPFDAEAGRQDDGPVSKGALIEPLTSVANAKIFAQPLQSATALRQLVRFGEEPQRRASLQLPL